MQLVEDAHGARNGALLIREERGEDGVGLRVGVGLGLGGREGGDGRERLEGLFVCLQTWRAIALE